MADAAQGDGADGRYPGMVSNGTGTSPTDRELQQVAGLAAGTVFRLGPGPLRLGLDPQVSGFELRPSPAGETILAPHSAAVRLDGVPVTGPTHVGDGVIDVGSARFVIGRRRRGSSLTQITSATGDWCDPVIPVPGPGEYSTEEVVARVAAARRVAMSRRRRAHPNPLALIQAARFDDGLRWSRRTDHPLFGQVALAHADIPWTPVFDQPNRIGPVAQAQIEPLRQLISVAVTADVRTGPIGLVGDRGPLLAAARQLIVSLTTLSGPDDLALAITPSSPHQFRDWEWTNALPHRHHPGTTPADHVLTVTVLDDPDPVTQVRLALLDGGPGLIVLAPSVASLPPDRAVTVFLDADGTAVIVDHREDRTWVGTTPLGLAESSARQVADDLQHAHLAREHLVPLG